MSNLQFPLSVVPKRSCGECTKCCEGHLHAVVHGYPMHKGRPCHFVALGKGCVIYDHRPDNPCKQFMCKWLTDPSIPEWLKPSLSNAIIYDSTVEGIPFLVVAEAGSKLSVEVLDFILKYVSENSLNIYYQIDSVKTWKGSEEFVKAINKVEGVNNVNK